MIAHRLLPANEVDVETPDRIDGPLEIVVSPLSICSLVDIEVACETSGRRLARTRRGYLRVPARPIMTTMSAIPTGRKIRTWYVRTSTTCQMRS